jgi:hypothetical protein
MWLWLLHTAANSQTTDSIKHQAVTFSGYVEAYYGYDLSRPYDNNRPPFIYSYSRHNEVNINLAFAKVSYTSGAVRGNLAFMAGTYANANLSQEPGVLKNVFEANVGLKLLPDVNLWIDAGVLPSHIGFESAVGKDCWTLTRSIVADNSPYYEAGARLGYTSRNEKLYLAVLVLNGWQHIQRPGGSSTLAGGTQLTYKPSNKLTLNYSTFIGNDKPDSNRSLRLYNNLYGIVTMTDKLGVTIGFDYGTEQKWRGSSSWSNWYAPVAILRYRLSDNVAIAARVEYYSDTDNAIIKLGAPLGFRTWGYSANVDIMRSEHLVWRVEGKVYAGKSGMFSDRGRPVNTNTSITTALAISF